MTKATKNISFLELIGVTDLVGVGRTDNGCIITVLASNNVEARAILDKSQLRALINILLHVETTFENEPSPQVVHFTGDI